MKDICAAKLGTPGPQGMKVCGKPAEYVSATPPEVPYSGWRHADRTIDANHWPVPKGSLR